MAAFSGNTTASKKSEISSAINATSPDSDHIILLFDLPMFARVKESNYSRQKIRASAMAKNNVRSPGRVSRLATTVNHIQARLQEYGRGD